MMIDSQEYLDGAVAGHNNPIEIAYDEVKQLFPSHEPKIIISIGTNPKDKKDETINNGRTASSTWRAIRRTIKQQKNAILDSRAVHKNFQDEHGFSSCYKNNNGLKKSEKPLYFRFEVPSDLPFKDVRLGDWKGLNGSDTKNAISEPTKEYLDRHAINTEIMECAKQLVQIRRERAKTERWEAFALDARLHYLCPDVEEKSELGEDSLCRGRSFVSRNSLRQHALERHGFAQKIPCVYHYRTSENGKPQHVSLRERVSQEGLQDDSQFEDIGWTCSRDDCVEKISAFDEERDFHTHLMTEHKEEKPLVIENQDLETWLNKGRRWLEKEDADELNMRRRTTLDPDHQ
jgi:hypothetical protein